MPLQPTTDATAAHILLPTRNHQSAPQQHTAKHSTAWRRMPMHGHKPLTILLCVKGPHHSPESASPSAERTSRHRYIHLTKQCRHETRHGLAHGSCAPSAIGWGRSLHRIGMALARGRCRQPLAAGVTTRLPGKVMVVARHRMSVLEKRTYLENAPDSRSPRVVG